VGQETIDRGIAEADRRPEGPAIGGDFLGNEVVAEFGGGQEPTEFGFGVIDQGRHQQFALVGDQDRPVIGDKFGAERDDKQHEENPQRPKTPPIGTEIGEAPAIDGRERTHSSRLSKSMRGSTHI
jgi:hypothetical protein